MHNHNHSSQKNIRTAFFLNVTFTIIEFIGGIFTNSLAIMSDALHDFGDSIVLGVAWFAEKKSSKGPDATHTFGHARLSVFSALLSGAVLIGGSLFILSQAIPRLLNPEAVHAKGMIILAVVGIVMNGLGALRLRNGKGLNEKVLTWHLFEDVLGWVGVLIGGVLIYFFDWPILDPILTIGFTVFILYGVVRSMREVLNILSQGVPKEISLTAVKDDLKTMKGVLDVHDVHIWSLEGTTNVLSAHIVVHPQTIDEAQEIQKMVKNRLHDTHRIEHSTIELETETTCTGDNC